MTLKVLIVDDEALARERLKFLLQDDPSVEIVGECRNGQEAIAAFRVVAVDLVLLDIQMPGETGFEVIEAIGPQRMPPTVFTTAYDEFALRAFQVQALDYLTKPIEPEVLTSMIARKGASCIHDCPCSPETN